jgi:hypothetical protein
MGAGAPEGELGLLDEGVSGAAAIDRLTVLTSPPGVTFRIAALP